MKTELRIAEHSVIHGANVVEVWHDGEFIGQVVGADVPGVRVITKHDVAVVTYDAGPNIVEVQISR